MHTPAKLNSTEQAFATFWQTENERRKHNPVAPKQEWALINFMQRFVAQHPTASQANMMQAWKVERERQVQIAYGLIEQCIVPV